MKRILALLWLSLTLGSLSFGALALGLGNIHLHSALGQRLDADIALAGVDASTASSLKVSLASQAQFKDAHVHYASILSTMSLKLVKADDGYHVKVTSKKPIQNPFLTLLVLAQWDNGQMLHEYTLLLDPPSYGAGAAETSASGTQQAHASKTNTASSKTPEANTPQSHSQSGAAHKPHASTHGTSAHQTTSAHTQPATSTPSAQHAQPVAVTPQTYGHIERGQTLWGISHELTSGDPVEVDQMMVAIYRANPHAFNGNINRLKAGAALKIPSMDRVHAISPREAIDAVKQANNRYTAAITAAQSQAIAQQQSDNAQTASPGVEADQANNSEQAQATVSPEVDVADNATSDAGNTTADAGESGHLQLVAPEAADTGLAGDNTTPGANQQAAAGTSGELPTDEAGNTESADQGAAQTSQAATPQPATQQQAQSSDTGLVSVEDENLNQLQTQQTPTDEAQPAAKPHLKVQTSQPKQPESMVDRGIDIAKSIGQRLTQPAYLIGLLVVLALIGIFFAKRRKKEGDKKPKDDKSAKKDKKPKKEKKAKKAKKDKPKKAKKKKKKKKKGKAINPADRVALHAGGDDDDDDDAQADDDNQTVEPALADEEGAQEEAAPASDPIAEADFNIDYGLYDQAAEVLQTAIEKDPARGELKAKLFQTYFAAGDQASFRNAAQQFAATWGAEEPDEWQKVAEMGRQIAPDEPLFAADDGQQAGATDDSATLSAETSSDDAYGVTTDIESPEPESPTSESEFDADGAVDLSDFDIGDNSANNDFADIGNATPEVNQGDDAAGTELGTELGTEIGTEFNVDDTPSDSAAETTEATETSTSAASDDSTWDFNLDMGDDASASETPAETSPAAAPADDSDNGVEFDLSGIDTDLTPPSDTHDGTEDNNPMLDTQTEFEDAIRELSEFVDTNLPDKSGETQTQLGSAGEAGEDNADALLADDEEDLGEMDTKLELAQAYIDMGDNDGARSILQEVIDEGGEQHKTQAQTILNNLG